MAITDESGSEANAQTGDAQDQQQSKPSPRNTKSKKAEEEASEKSIYNAEEIIHATHQGEGSTGEDFER